MLRHERFVAETHLDDVIAFLRAANPFAQQTCGWDLGRFLDWRWGGSGAHAESWFAENCMVFRDDAGLRAVWLREDDRDPTTYIITGREDPEAVRAVVDVVTGPDRFEVLSGAHWFGTVLAESGYESEPGHGQEWEYDPTLASLPALPPGYRFASGADGLDVESLSACIVRAFGRSGSLVSLLERLATNPFHDPELAVAVLAPDGTVAAYCQGTVDPGNGVGGIDPVVTHPDHQRRGLGKAVVSACLVRQTEKGGRMVFIGSAKEPAPETNLYRSLGPRWTDTTVVWTPPAS